MIRDLFVKFRRSNAFLYTLAAAAIISLIAHFAVSYDPEWSLSNLFLSLEASFASCMLLDLMFRMSGEDRERWDRIERTLNRVERELLDVAEEVSQED